MTIRNANRWLLLGLALTVGSYAGHANASTITIVVNDGAGEGFNDPSPRAPVGGNPGTTLGQQRLNVFQAAANIWGGILPSAVTIEVRSQFDPQFCDAGSAVLGSAGPTTIHRDFSGAILAGHWYHQSLANKLAGTDLNVANPDINATFNSQLDGGACLGGLVWYYGLDGNEGANVELLPVVIHEMGHGLGFSTPTSGATGNFNGGFPSVYDHFLFDDTAGLHWDQMTAGQRQASAVNNLNLVWDGANAVGAAPSILNHVARLIINSPGGIAGTYTVVTATFGSAPTVAGVTGTIVLVNDGVGTTSDGCEPIINGAALAGNIALIDRGTCAFVNKAAAAQAAGATAVIIANNAPGLPPNPMGGTDPSITIPVIGISQADANLIKANLPAVNGTVGAHPTQLAGSDAAGRPQMYAPTSFTSGSSVSHWDIGATPNLLMEPFINTNLHDGVDLARYVFADIGWNPASVGIALNLFTAESRTDGVFLRWAFANLAEVGSITIQRAANSDGPWAGITTELGAEGGVSTALDMSAEPGQSYFYRLQVTDRAGNVSTIGRASGQRMVGSLVLRAPSPNPMSIQSSITFRIGRPEFVRLAVTDVSGRKIRTIHEGMMAPGEYTRTWNGQSDRSSRVSPGMYFLTLSTGTELHTQRIAVMQ